MTTGAPERDVVGPTGCLELRFLGDVHALDGGRPIDALGAARVRSLLAYLVLHGDVPIPRRRLAFEFWPDSADAQARTNLRNLLHTVRRTHPVLDASIEVTPSTLRWVPGAAVVVDVERFLAAAELAEATDPDDSGQLIDRCRLAADLHGGELLPDDHDDWLDPWREALRARHCAVLRLLATALIDAGRPDEARPVTARLVRADPLDESAHRLRIEAHGAAGDRSGAVRAYHECVTVLDRELGVAPSTATTRQYESVVGSPSPAHPSTAGPRAMPGLVGRDDEWRTLVDAWDAARTGPPRFVLVTGEAGIGKTRLVEELAAWCRTAGAAIGVARSYLAEGELGFALVVSWLRSPDLTAARRQLRPDETAPLARILPELDVAGHQDDLDETERRRRLFDAATRALTGSGRPTLLIADDAQWSDRASQELIHYLLRQDLAVPVLVVATARDEDVDEVHPLTTVRDSLAQLDRVVELRLPRLGRQATIDLGQHLVGGQLDDDDAEALYAESEGNPLFVVETIRSGWHERGVRRAASPRLRAVIEARLRRLTPAARELLGVASVVGRPFSPSLLQRVSGSDDRAVAQALDELWRRRILREVDQDAYDFCHGKLREAAYEALSPAARRRHHLVVAESLAERAAEHGDVASTEVASHYEAADQTERAVAWLERSASDAQQVYAYEDAVRLLERALGHVPSLPPAVRHQRELELLSALPLALAGVDGFGTTRMTEAHRRAVDVAARLGVELDPTFVRSMVMSALCRDEFDDAARAANRLLDHGLATGDDSLRIESHYLLGIAAFWAAQLEDARRHFETVVQGFDARTRRAHQGAFGHDPQVVCLSRLANTLWFLGHEHDARQACRDALALADEVAHPLSHDTAVIFACLLVVDLGDHGALTELSDKLGRLGMDSLPHRIKREALLGFIDVLDGRRREGIARSTRALDECGGRNFYPGFRTTIARLLVAAHRLTADTEGGLLATERALGLGGTRLWDAEVHRVRAELLAAAGAGTEAVLAELGRAAAVAARQGAAGHLRRIEATRRSLTKRSGNGASRSMRA